MILKQALLLAIVATQTIFAWSYTGIETLERPTGTEGRALGSSGVAFSNEPGSIFYNPANAALYGQRANTNFWFSSSSLPLNYYLLEEKSSFKSRNYGAFIPYCIGDFGIAVNVSSSTTLAEGGVYQYDIENWQKFTIDNYHFSEKIKAMTLSSVWKEYVALGVTVKPYQCESSDLATTKGAVFDIGGRGQYLKKIGSKFYIQPGVGVAFQNLGKDSVTYSDSQSNALPKTFQIGGSFECGMPNVIWVTVMQELKKQLVKLPEGSTEDPLFSRGIQLGLTPLFQVNMGKSFYKKESNVRKDIGLTVGYRHAQFMKCLNTITSSSRFQSELFNFHFTFSTSLEDEIVRSNQFSAGFGMAILTPKQKAAEIPNVKHKENELELELELEQ